MSIENTHDILLLLVSRESLFYLIKQEKTTSVETSKPTMEETNPIRLFNFISFNQKKTYSVKKNDVIFIFYIFNKNDKMIRHAWTQSPSSDNKHSWFNHSRFLCM